MLNQIVKVKSKKRFLLLALGLGVMIFLMWQGVRANAGVSGFPAQIQVDQVVPSLIASEAEHASGAYVPGVGAVFIMDLLRGPNSAKGKIPAYGVRDWSIYLMQTFGPKLDAVPPTETIAFSIEFYDYSTLSYHQFVLTSKAADVSDPAKYVVWLDGKPFSQAAPPQPTNTVPAVTPGASGQATPKAGTTPAASNKTPAPSSAKAPTGGASTGVPVSVIAPTAGPTAPIAITKPTAIAFNLADQAGGKDWKPLNGQWAIDTTGYTQNQLGFYDLITFYTRSISGSYNFQVDMQYISGQMGGGLVFNSPSDTSKNGSQMISYTGSGKYLQWGYFDANGIFQFQAGTPIPNGADGKAHRLQVRVKGTQYTVLLDGVTVGKSAPLWGPNGGYVGLLASISQVVFTNAKLEQLGP